MIRSTGFDHISLSHPIVTASDFLLHAITEGFVQGYMPEYIENAITEESRELLDEVLESDPDGGGCRW